MKIRLSLVMCMCFCAITTFAQEPQRQRPAGGTGNREGAARLSVEDMSKAQSDRMKTDFKLDDKQYKSISEINLKYAKKMRESTTRDSATFAKMQTEKDAEVKKVLTTEQYKKYTDQLKEQASRPIQGGNRQGTRQRN